MLIILNTLSPVNVAFDLEQITIHVKLFFDIIRVLFITKKQSSVEVPFWEPRKGKMVSKRQHVIYRELLLQ